MLANQQTIWSDTLSAIQTGKFNFLRSTAASALACMDSESKNSFPWKADETTRIPHQKKKKKKT